MICTVYSHSIGFDKVRAIIEKTVPKASINVSENEGSIVTVLESKTGLFGSVKKIKITYRERAKPSYRIPEVDDSPLTANLKGLYGYVSKLPTNNEKVKGLFLQKILTINSEFSISQEQGEWKELRTILASLASELDAVLFVQPKTIISKSASQHFLNKNLELIIDSNGDCEIDHLAVNIDSVYFDGEQDQLTQDQIARRKLSESILETHQIKINKHLPCITAETDVVIRSAQEIARRVSVLAVTNLVAFNSITGEQALHFLSKYGLSPFITPNERAFLTDPTDEKKSVETWKCECIWTLMWALNKVNQIGFPNELCNLGNIPAEEYPIAPDKDPNDFINSKHVVRSPEEILDFNDLYYRLEWAAVDARINGREIKEVHPGVVYERHYALNWLINYRGQEWDDISCDT